MQYDFYEARSFDKDSKFGKIKASDRERLEFDVMLGCGEVIPGTGDLKQIHCGLGGCYGTTDGWQVVFADYPEHSITFLLIRFPDKFKTSLSREEIKELKYIKQILDEAVKKKYGKST
jgi:hypothetical protein